MGKIQRQRVRDIIVGVETNAKLGDASVFDQLPMP
jgi:hypothetical protein